MRQNVGMMKKIMILYEVVKEATYHPVLWPHLSLAHALCLSNLIIFPFKHELNLSSTASFAFS
jgi:hypothetical protein